MLNTLNTLNLLTRLPWFKPRVAVHRNVRKCWLDEPLAADAERPLGCGWFDSSHELERGLQVHEADVQGLCLLPWSDWLDLELRVWAGHTQPG